MNLEVKKGEIKAVKIYGDFFGTKDITEIEELLVGVKHEETAIRETLSQIKIEEYFHQMSLDDLISVLF